MYLHIYILIPKHYESKDMLFKYLVLQSTTIFTYLNIYIHFFSIPLVVVGFLFLFSLYINNYTYYYIVPMYVLKYAFIYLV